MTITCVNDTPVAVNDTANTTRNTLVTIDVLANDTDDDLSTVLGGITAITGLVSVSGGTASILGTGIVFIPTTGVCGTGLFMYQASDASGALSNIATGTVSIACTNTAPTAVDQTLTINEDSTGSINFLSGASDIDTGDVISFSGFIVSPSNGTLTSTGFYIPNANFC